jgi:hypothetical protein
VKLLYHTTAGTVDALLEVKERGTKQNRAKLFFYELNRL